MQMPSPNPAILARKTKLAARLSAVLPADAVIQDEMETRAYECDALTAYKCPPLLAVLPRTTQEVSDILRICHEEGVPVVPRGAGTSLAGGALPTADCVILGVARMNEVLETDYENRIIRVQTGRTNLSVSGAVEEEDFFYAPDPSSQLACAIAGNIAMNSGGAHCLKYGVTTNNLLGVTMVMMDGTVVEIGGAHLDAGGLDLLGLICGSEGQLAVVTFHSLEDRIAKRFLQDRASYGGGGSRYAPEAAAREPGFTLTPRRAIAPDADEIARNPRARSAKLRVARRTSAPAVAPDGDILGLPRLSEIL